MVKSARHQNAAIPIACLPINIHRSLRQAPGWLNRTIHLTRATPGVGIALMEWGQPSRRRKHLSSPQPATKGKANELAVFFREESKLYKASFQCDSDCVCPIGRAEFRKYTFDMVFDGMGGNVQRRGDLFI